MGMPSTLADRELLARLVAFDTTSDRPTTELFDFVCDYLDLPGIRCERFPCRNGHENVLFLTGPEPNGSDGFAFCGHVDTVPAEEPDWTNDPRELVERDGRLHARGACDMKGFDAIAINLMVEFATQEPASPIGLLLTHSEEVGTVGAGEFVAHWPAERPFPKNVVVGEPTSLHPVRGHKGHIALRFTVGGVPCHTGYPQEGVNAVEAAVPLLTGLKKLREQLVEERTPESCLFADVPFAVLTIAGVEAGTAINIMPEQCVIDVGVRLLPGQDAEEFLVRVRTVIEGADLHLRDKPEAEGCVLEVLNNTPAFGIPAEDPFLAQVMDLVDATEALGVGFGTDAGRLEALGCRSVIFGPGDISVAHKPDEWMPIDEFERAPGLLRCLVANAVALDAG